MPLEVDVPDLTSLVTLPAINPVPVDPDVTPFIIKSVLNV